MLTPNPLPFFTAALRPYWVIVVIGALLFIPFLGYAPLFDWDEINFAESAREMLVTHNYTRVQINFQPFWEKPPLFIWLQALSMSIFGINEFAARLPNALCGIAILLVLFHTGKKYYSERLGWLWALMYIGSFLPHLYLKSGVIDPVFNLLTFVGILQLIKLTNATEAGERIKHAALAGISIGLAVLTKGPVGLLMPILAFGVMVILKRDIKLVKIKEAALLIALVLIVSSLWYGLETMKNGTWFLSEFFKYQIGLLTTAHPSHDEPIYYHVAVLLVGCFPASFFLFGAWKKNNDDTLPQRNFKLWMTVLLLVVVVVFSLVQTKIVHYSSLAYFPLSFLAAYMLNRSFEQESTIAKLKYIALIAIASIICVVLLLPPFLINNPVWILAISSDPVLKLYMDTNPHWPWWLAVPGVLYLTGLLVSLWFFVRQRKRLAVVFLFVSTAVTVEVGAIMLTGQIGAVSQGPPVDFFKQYAHKDVYLEILGYKSFAQYFYGEKRLTDVQTPALQAYIKTYSQGSANPDLVALEHDWHLEGEIDKPVYFSCRRKHAEIFAAKYPQLKEVSRSWGFVFFVREK